jgi:hypothetical protein
VPGEVGTRCFPVVTAMRWPVPPVRACWAAFGRSRPKPVGSSMSPPGSEGGADERNEASMM